MKKFIIIFVIVIFVFMLWGINRILEFDKPSERSKLTDKIKAVTAKEIHKRFELRCIGTGGGDAHDVSMLFMAFKSYEPFDIQRGRKLIVDCVNEYLKNVNENEQVRPYLHNYPFLPENIEMVIFGPNLIEDPPNLKSVSLREGVIEYRIKKTENSPLENTHEETFQEALKILEEEKSKQS